MFYFVRVILLSALVFILSCAEKTYYSGKIIKNYENFKDIKTKKELLNIYGEPNYIDPIESKYYYFSEVQQSTNLLNKKTINRNIYIYTLEENNIVAFREYNLNDSKNINYNKETTDSILVKRGLVEKIFGGVTNKKISNTPQ